MKEMTKKEKRRAYLLDDFWFKLYGNPASPRRYTRQWRTQMGIRS